MRARAIRARRSALCRDARPGPRWGAATIWARALTRRGHEHHGAREDKRPPRHAAHRAAKLLAAGPRPVPPPAPADALALSQRRSTVPGAATQRRRGGLFVGVVPRTHARICVYELSPSRERVERERERERENLYIYRMARNHTSVVLDADVGSGGGDLDYSSAEVGHERAGEGCACCR